MATAENFSIYLREELGRRRRQNPSYSLRSFAKNLGVSSAYLSKLTNGKRAVAEKTLLKMAARLDMPRTALETYRAKLPTFKPEQLEFESIALDRFQAVSDWHHYAILEAVTLDDFEPTAAWFASRLRISKDKAQAAIERLLRLSYLKLDEAGSISRKVRNHSTAHHPVPSSACREHERQVLELAIRALDEVDIESRDQTSMTLAIPSSRLTEARELIDRFRSEMTALLQRKGKRDSIYHLSVSFYPVTEPQPPTQK